MWHTYILPDVQGGGSFGSETRFSIDIQCYCMAAVISGATITEEYTHVTMALVFNNLHIAAHSNHLYHTVWLRMHCFLMFCSSGSCCNTFLKYIVILSQ